MSRRGDDVELACACTLEGYTQIQPLSCLIRAGSANDQPWTCELLMSKFYVSIDIVDSTGKRIEGAGVELRSSKTWSPTNRWMWRSRRRYRSSWIRPTHLSHHFISEGSGGEYFFRDRWHAADASIIFSSSDFEVWRGGPIESLKRSVMKSDDPAIPS